MQRVETAFIALGQKLRFVGRHIDLHGALGFAGFAAEAEVQSFVDRFALEAFCLQSSGEHLPEQACAAAGGVLFKAGGTVAGAHDATFGLATGADTDASFGRAGEGAFVFGEGEVSFSQIRRIFGVRPTHGMGSPVVPCNKARGSHGCIRRRQLAPLQVVAQIFKGVVDAHRIDQLAGIHAVVGIPERFEFAKGLHQLRTEHFGQEGGAGLTVAMLPAEGASVAENDIGGAVEKFAEIAQPLFGVEIEIDAHVHAALSVVAVERAAIAVLIHQRGDAAQVSAELRRRHSGIFPTFEAVGLTRDEDDGAESGFADIPDTGGFFGSADMGSGRARPVAAVVQESFSFEARFFGGPCPHLDEQVAYAGGKLIEFFERETFASHEIDEQMVEAFEADGAVIEGARDGVGSQKSVRESQHRKNAEGRTGGEVKLRRDNCRAGAFTADQGAGDVKAVFGEQLVEVIAGDAARDTGKLFANQVGIAIANTGKARVECAGATPCTNEAVELIGTGAADGHAGAVVEDNIQRLDIVGDFAAKQAVDAAAVVADHAAEGAAGVGGWVGRVGEVVLFGSIAEAVEDDAGLDGRELHLGVDAAESVHVARKIEDHGDIGALAGQAGSGAAGQHGSSGSAACGKGGLDVGCVAGIDDAYGELAVV